MIDRILCVQSVMSWIHAYNYDDSIPTEHIAVGTLQVLRCVILPALN